MEIVNGKEVQDLYVVRVDTGLDKNNEAYMQLHISSDENAQSSAFRLFCRPDDENVQNWFADTDRFFEDGAKKRTVLESALPIGQGRLMQVTFAPCEYKIGTSGATFIKNSENRVILGADGSAKAYAAAMVQRVYQSESCVGFYSNFKTSDDYRKYVMFRLTRSELESFMEKLNATSDKSEDD